VTDSFPRLSARTQRFTLGEPRNLIVSPDGRRVVFARSRAGDDPVNCLWVLDASTGDERLVADPRSLLAGAEEESLPPEERARRERAREGAGGVVAYACDAQVRVAAFALGGRLFVAGLLSGQARELPVEGPVFDPRPDPTASRLAYVCGRSLRIAELDGRSRVLAGPGASEPDDPDVSWGAAEFIAAEEMGRSRGFWWAPDGRSLAVARVDSSPIQRWWISDPAVPERPPTEVAYPAAGTDNALVTLHVVSLDGGRVDVRWDRQLYPYLADVTWTEGGLLATLQSRHQRALVVVEVDPATGETAAVFEDADEQWVELVPGTPGRLADGRLVMASDRDGARRLVVDGAPVTPPDLQVRSVVDVSGDRVVFLANELDRPLEQHVHRWSEAGLDVLTTEVGVHTAAAGGRTVVSRTATLDQPLSRTQVVGGPVVGSHAMEPPLTPAPHFLQAGDRRIATAVLLPAGAGPDDRLPVLLDPYGGPHAQRVVAARSAFLASQWFADQGFAVVVADGRGTPGRGSEWERAVFHDLAGPVLEDQIEALHVAATELPQLDLSRVAIRGWSFGGYLAALAVLRRPDVFHAAVAGAPVTEWRLYDTHYTERYLGDPGGDPAPYERCSLLTEAAKLERPLLLVHGLADDNVVAAHTLQLSSALLAAGRPHQVLPLSGVTHMTPQEVVAENLLLLQLDFLRAALA
jgi:dipeptidyl-peptidase-4